MSLPKETFEDTKWVISSSQLKKYSQYTGLKVQKDTQQSIKKIKQRKLALKTGGYIRWYGSL